MDNQVKVDNSTRVFNPWNPRNKEIELNNIHFILRKFGWHSRVRSIELFKKACTHRSYVDRPDLWAEQSDVPMIMAEKPDNCIPLRKTDNEELEFVGDSVLGCVVATYLSKRYPGEGEGFLTRLRTRIVNNIMLGKLSKVIGLHNWVILSRHVEEICNGRNNLRILGSVLEAWIGAMYMQEEKSGNGFQICYDWIVSLMERHVDFVQFITEDTNYKDQLLRLFQSQYHQPPRYKEVAAIGPPHDRTFTIGVLDVEDNIIATSTARNKKMAEQEASRIALDILLETVNPITNDNKISDDDMSA